MSSVHNLPYVYDEVTCVRYKARIGKTASLNPMRQMMRVIEKTLVSKFKDFFSSSLKVSQNKLERFLSGVWNEPSIVGLPFHPSARLQRFLNKLECLCLPSNFRFFLYLPFFSGAFLGGAIIGASH
jgi:hypothetical protein